MWKRFIIIFFLFANTAFGGGLWVCENWEADDYGIWADDIGTNGTCSYDVSTDYAHSGTRSLKLHPQADGGYVMLRKRFRDKPTDEAGVQIYVRFWIYISSALLSDFEKGNSETLGILGCMNSGWGIEWECYLYGYAGSLHMDLEYGCQGTPGTLNIIWETPSAGWHCVEFIVLADTDGSNGAVYSWWDGVFQDADIGVNTLGMDYSMIFIGQSWWSNEVTTPVYIDDLCIWINTDNYGAVNLPRENMVANGSCPYF